MANAVGSGSAAYYRSSLVNVFPALAAVGLPLAWGVYRTLIGASTFFH
ncbi:MAG: hypothetical protein M3Y55_03610 [Pseudomonadota bacterium]|nr:hypothetical protein [Pseudomonadota bacterium]